MSGTTADPTDLPSLDTDTSISKARALVDRQDPHVFAHRSFDKPTVRVEQGSVIVSWALSNHAQLGGDVTVRLNRRNPDIGSVLFGQ
jgi:hypothetical protein